MKNALGVLVLILMGVQLFGQDSNLPLSGDSTGPTHTTHRLSAEDYQKITVSGPIVLIDFYAPWCGPCKLMEPILLEVAEAQEGKVQVVRINIDDNRDLIRSMNILEIPALKIYKHGKEAWSGVGVIEKRAINKQLKKL